MQLAFYIFGLIISFAGAFLSPTWVSTTACFIAGALFLLMIGLWFEERNSK